MRANSFIYFMNPIKDKWTKLWAQTNANGNKKNKYKNKQKQIMDMRMNSGKVLALWRLRNECAIYYRATRVAIKLDRMNCCVKISHSPARRRIPATYHIDLYACACQMRKAIGYRDITDWHSIDSVGF